MEAEEVEQRLEALSLRIEGVDQTVTMLVNVLDDYAKQMQAVGDMAVVAEWRNGGVTHHPAPT